MKTQFILMGLDLNHISQAPSNDLAAHSDISIRLCRKFKKLKQTSIILKTKKDTRVQSFKK